MRKELNAGKYNKKIQIISITEVPDDEGFKKPIEGVIINAWAEVKTSKGYTLIQNNTDFEKAYTNFTIRYPKANLNRDMFVKYNDRVYEIEYLNNIDNESLELEIQAKLVVK